VCRPRADKRRKRLKTLVGKTFSLPVKIQGDSYGSNVDESEYDNQISLSPAILKGQGIKLENKVCNKKK
jgi:hypothetical protein